MDTFWLLASGGSTVEEFAKDVYLKSNIKNRIGFYIKQILQDVYGQDDLGGIGSESLTTATTNPASTTLGTSSSTASGISEKRIITEVSSPAVASLVNCFEAAFLHGLKGKPLLNRMIGKSSSRDTTNQTDYKLDFWSVILILSHNQVSESLGQLNNIRTDIGRCRAWLRLTLNDGLLRSYLDALINDTSLLHGFYRPSAYLRDKEHMDCLREIMEPLKLATFQLNYDHYLLNNWTNDTLKLIGITVQDTAPVVTAVDALSVMGDKRAGSSVVKRKDLIRKRFLTNSWDNGLASGPSSGSVKGSTKEQVKEPPKETVKEPIGGGKSDLPNLQSTSSKPSTNSIVQITQSDDDDPPVQSVNVKTSDESKESSAQQTTNKIPNSSDTRVTDATLKLGSLSIKGEDQKINSQANPDPEQPEVRRPMLPGTSRTRNLIGESAPGSTLHLPSSSSAKLSSAASDSLSVGGNSISNRGGWSTSPPGEEEEEPYESLLYSISTNAMLSSTPDIKEFIFSRTSDNNDNRSVVSNESERSPTPSNSVSGRRSSGGSRGLSLFKRRKSISTKSDSGRNQNEIIGGGSSGNPGTVASRISSLGGNDFEIIPKTMVLNSQEPETQEFLLHLTRIANHVGLDEQDYKCYSCGRPIGMIYGKFRVCEFDGFNYCTECHSDEKWVIPARAVNNWDFKKYPVANRNKKRLQLIESEPLIDIKVSASILYKIIKELQEVLDLRTQLFYLHAYLFTCKEQVATGLRRILWPRDHLYEHIHLYSTADLIQIQSGTTLNSLLRKAIQFARKHVLSCILCSQKGFICEICKSPQIIYPFDTSITYRCDNCKAVFHISCFITESGKRPCPRCLRIRRRERAVVTI